MEGGPGFSPAQLWRLGGDFLTASPPLETFSPKAKGRTLQGMVRAWFCFCICLLVAGAPAWSQTAAHLYSPGSNLERYELAQLETATRTLDVAMYSFTDRELAEKLASLARKGVRVRVYRDREQVSQEMLWGGVTTTGILLTAGVEVRVKGTKNLMHLKSYAIDGRLLRSGSANWSPTGLKRQDNDVLYETAPDAVRTFRGEV